MSTTTLRTAPLTTAQKRILALVSERPGLKFSHAEGARSCYYSIWDSRQGQFDQRTSTGAVHGLIDAGLLPVSVLMASICTHLGGGVGGLMISRRTQAEIEALAEGCGDYLTRTPAEIEAGIKNGDLGWDEYGDLHRVCQQCGNTAPECTCDD